jgi:hypothetical protein
MPDPRTFALGGLVWTISPMDFDEQIEAECIFARTLGPALGSAVRVGVAGVIPMFIDVLREMAGKGERFNLENLANRWHAFLQDEDGTRDPKVRQVWEDFLGVLSDSGGEAIHAAVSTIAMRVHPEDARRLFDLAILNNRKTMVATDGKQVGVSDMGTLSRLLLRDPRAKWELLGKAVRVTYRPDHFEQDEDEDDGEQAEGAQGDA